MNIFLFQTHLFLPASKFLLTSDLDFSAVSKKNFFIDEAITTTLL